MTCHLKIDKKQHMNKLIKIEIRWDGPYNLDEIKGLKTDKDYGLYQIYGTHNVNGPNSLLYIGQANYQKLATRITQHENWIEWEYSYLDIYIGRLGGIDKIDPKKWEQQIDIAEKLLIYYCAPPYNTGNRRNYGDDIKDTIIINFGKKNRLPMEVSTFYNDSSFWEDKRKWKEYEVE